MPYAVTVASQLQCHSPECIQKRSIQESNAQIFYFFFFVPLFFCLYYAQFNSNVSHTVFICRIYWLTHSPLDILFNIHKYLTIDNRHSNADCLFIIWARREVSNLCFTALQAGEHQTSMSNVPWNCMLLLARWHHHTHKTRTTRISNTNNIEFMVIILHSCW